MKYEERTEDLIKLGITPATAILITRMRRDQSSELPQNIRDYIDESQIFSQNWPKK